MTVTSEIACLDVAYGDDAAAVACVLIHEWQAASASQTLSRRVRCEPVPYEPGAFYKRELPLLRSIIDELSRPLDAIVIDGYVWLGGNGEPGLGAHLFQSLGPAIPVIGVAKTRYQDDTWSTPVTRGASNRPLFVTAAGIKREVGANAVCRMHGDHRIPTMLRLVDQIARDALANDSRRRQL
jgi:deoxyribonuclease V